MPDTKRKPVSVALARLNPLAYKELHTSPFQLLCRLVVLTKNGAQTCVYNNDHAAAELGFSPSTTLRSVKRLAECGFVRVKFESTPFGTNSRIISLNAAKLKLSEPAATPISVTTLTAAEANAPKPMAHLYTATAPKAENIASATIPPQSLLNDKPGDEEDAKYFASRRFTEDDWSKIIQTDPADPLVRRYARYQARRFIVPNSAQMICHQELYRFDFADALAAQGIGPIRFGSSEPTTVVNFTEFAEYMSAANATDKPNYYDTAAFVKWLEKYYQFCVMTEISYYSDQLFSAPETCDHIDLKKINLFFGQHQQGLFPVVMAPLFGFDYVDARNGDDDFWYCSESLWRCISAKYTPRFSQSPVKYLTSCVIRQFLECIADQSAYRKSFAAFSRQFERFALCQRWNSDASLALQRDQFVTQHYYPLPLNQLLDIDGVKISFRVTYPLLLLRKAYMSYSAAGLHEWYTERNLAHCRDLIKMAATDPDVKMQWDAFKAFHCHDYPFLNKLEAANV